MKYPDFDIDCDSKEFQSIPHEYLNLQYKFAELESGNPLSIEESKQIIKDACGRLHLLNYLKANYRIAIEQLNGKT